MRKPRKSGSRVRAKLRMVKRGWTQPDKGVRQQIAAGIKRKVVKSATFDELLGTWKKSGFEGLASAIRVAAKKQKVEITLRTMRTATKYALDAVGITDQETRAEIHSLTKDMAETVLYSGHNSISERHARGVISAIAEKIGSVKTALFFGRFFPLSVKMLKESRAEYIK